MGPSPDWVKLAEAFGWTGMRCDDKGELAGAMGPPSRPGPVLLDVHVPERELLSDDSRRRRRKGHGRLRRWKPGHRSWSSSRTSRPPGALTGRKHVLSLLVENRPGVLARIAGLFSRRGFNIDTLAVGPTEDPDVSRITLTLDGAVHPIDQVTKQLHKLVNVIKIRDMEPDRRSLARWRCSGSGRR